MITVNQQAIIDQAIQIIESTYHRENYIVESAANVKKYLQLQLATLEHEAFAVMFLDTSHKLIAFEIMFRGTIDGASVYPREVAKLALKHNAAAVILSHNHPSGKAEPSRADIKLTERLLVTLELFDIRILDHIIVSPIETNSFSELGLLL